MPRPPGIRLTDAESAILSMWRDTLTLVPGQGGANAVLADALGVREQHISSVLTGRLAISRPALQRLLRMVADDGLTGSVHVDALRRKGSADVREILDVLRARTRRPPRPVGRGRAEMVGGIG